MTAHRPTLGRLLRLALAGAHGLVLLAAVAVPVYAIADAARGLVSMSPDERSALLDVWRWLPLLRNTGVICGIAAGVALGIGGVLGLFAARTDLPGRGLLIGAALFGACLPVYISSIFFFAVVATTSLHESAAGGGLLYGLAYAPLATLALAAAFWRADRGLEEQALLDARPWTVLVRITVPQAVWAVVVTGLIIVLLVATDYTITDLLSVRTFAEECYTQSQLAGRRSGPLLTGLPVLVVFAALLAAVQLRFRILGEHAPWHFGGAPRVFTLGRWRRPAGALCGLLLAMGLGLPAGALAAAAVGRPYTAANLSHAGGILAREIAVRRGELLLSTALATAGATLIVLPAVGLASAAARGRWPVWAVFAAVVLLLATPAPVVGISLDSSVNCVLSWLDDSRPLYRFLYELVEWFAVVAGYFVRFLSVGVLLLIPGVRRVPHDLVLAARIDGCDWLRVQRHVFWPAVLRDLAIAWLVLVVLCYGELGATYLLAPPERPGWGLTTQRAWGLMHSGEYRGLAAIALLSIAFILLPWAVLVSFLRRAVRRAQ